MTADAAIVIADLTKIFHPLQLRLRSLRPIRRQPPVRALQDVSMTVRRGDIVGILGTNGAGKTTLLKILATLVLPTAGRVIVQGHEVGRDDDRIRALIGLAFGEERSFYWRLTGRQNLEFFAAFQGLGAHAARARILRLRDQLGLEALDRRVGPYSTGMKHRLAMARALLHEPQILLLDEPTRSLDPLAAANLRRVIRDEVVRSAGRTALVATHNLEEAETLCNRIIILHQGRMVACGTLAELQRQHGGDTVRLADIFERLTGQAVALMAGGP